jgi:hypothetical protein
MARRLVVHRGAPDVPDNVVMRAGATVAWLTFAVKARADAASRALHATEPGLVGARPAGSRAAATRYNARVPGPDGGDDTGTAPVPPTTAADPQNFMIECLGLEHRPRGTRPSGATSRMPAPRTVVILAPHANSMSSPPAHWPCTANTEPLMAEGF